MEALNLQNESGKEKSIGYSEMQRDNWNDNKSREKEGGSLKDCAGY
ncbi:unnamed protein product [Brugia timori]|uniref:Uncharacterized protein n=1 Tax=Brugia timori TaxID=42155 RepID=A0A3P7SVF0_9BILA|nr:unnamed protein product [Brugia timori]